MKLLAPSVKHTRLNKTSQYLLKPQSNTDFTEQLMIKPANHEYQYQLTNKTRKPIQFNYNGHAYTTKIKQ